MLLPSMLGFSLRSQPSRPPPPFDPAIEAWLDSLPPPATRPSRRELRQWRLTDYHGLGRSVFVTCVVLRAVSLALALSVTGAIASVASGRTASSDVLDRLVPALVVCPVVALWNAAEFVTACLLRDGGISPTIHMFVDGILFVSVAISMGVLLVDIICGIGDFGSAFDAAATEISSVCLLVILMVIHSFLLFFFVCNYFESARRNGGPDGGHPASGHAHLTAPWSQVAPPADKTALSPSPEPPKFGHANPAVELEQFDTDTRPLHEQPGFAIAASQYQAEMEWPPAVASGGLPR